MDVATLLICLSSAEIALETFATGNSKAGHLVRPSDQTSLVSVGSKSTPAAAYARKQLSRCGIQARGRRRRWAMVVVGGAFTMQSRRVKLSKAGLFGVDPAANSPPLKQDHRQVSISSGERSYSPSRVEEEEREAGEGVVEGGTKRLRGRPPGSKNKPKPPIILDRDSADSLRSVVLEIATGSEIVNSISEYARRCRRGICVLSAKGSVANVTLRQPAAPGSALALCGRFEILSLSGTLLPDTPNLGCSALTIYLAGAQGRVVGGTVVGSLVAAEPVIIIAATFSNAIYQRLPIEEDDPAQEAPLLMPE